MTDETKLLKMKQFKSFCPTHACTTPEVEGIDGQPPIVSILPGETNRLPSPTQISSSYSVHPSVHACRLGIQRKMAQAQQIWSIIL